MSKEQKTDNLNEENFKLTEELRQEAKAEDPEGEKEIRQKAHEARLSLVTRQEELSREISVLREQVARHEIGLSGLHQEIRQMENEITKSEKSLIGKLINFFNIRTLRRQLTKNIEKVAVVEAEYDQAMNLLSEMEDIVSEKSDIESIRSMAKDYYGKFVEGLAQKKKAEAERQKAAEEKRLLKEKEQEREARDVNNVCLDNNCLIVHGFDVKTHREGQGAHTVISPKVSWQKKVNILLALDPEISCSSVRENSQDGYMYPFGVIINKGEIEHAFRGDSNTGVIGTNRLTDEFSEMSLEEKKKKINEAINRKPFGHNEIVVRQPRIAAFYLSANYRKQVQSLRILNEGDDPEKQWGELDRLAEEIEQISQNLQVPVVIMDNGKFYLAKKIGIKAKIWIADQNKQISPQQIISRGIELSADEKKAKIEEVFNDCPFRLDLDEKRLVNGYLFGKKMMKLILESPDPESLSQKDAYYLNNMRRGMIDISGNNLSFNVNNPVIGVESMVQALEDVKNKLAEGLAKAEAVAADKNNDRRGKEKADKEISSYRKVLQRWAYFSYGIAEEVKDKREGSQKQIQVLASDVLDVERFSSVIKKRLGEDGRFRMTQDDLKHISLLGE
jgi:hypothetical protein